MDVKKIGVIGAGTMGHGIALVAAQAGFDVVLQDTIQDFVDRGLQRIIKFCEKSVAKERMTEDQKKGVVARVTGTTNLDDLKDVDVVIEAVFENPQVKKEIFTRLDTICKKECVFASNTDYGIGRGNKEGESIYWYAFHESCSSDEIGGGDTGTADIR